MRGFLKLVARISGLPNLFRALNRQPRVLFWHGVDIDPCPQVEPESIRFQDFQRQIEHLIRHFEIISMDDFLIRYQENKFSGREVVLTFDDGYRNNLEILAPYMRSKNLPYTVFVSTNHIQTGDLYPTSLLRLAVFGNVLHSLKCESLGITFELSSLEAKIKAHKTLSSFIKRRPLQEVNQVIAEIKSQISSDAWQDLLDKFGSVLPMNWKELSLLAESGATIGSHCMDHICCHDNQDNAEMFRQITLSKNILEKELGAECKYFAYPNGDFTIEANEAVLAAGYELGFSTKKAKISGQPRTSIPRVSVPYNYDSFVLTLSLFPR